MKNIMEQGKILSENSGDLTCDKSVETPESLICSVSDSKETRSRFMNISQYQKVM